MKTTLSLACLLLIGAQAINVTQTDATKEPASTAPIGTNEEDLMLTTYIGFEFEGAELAEKFSALDKEEQNTVRMMVEDLINDYWTEVGEPTLDEEEMAAAEEG